MSIDVFLVVGKRRFCKLGDIFGRVPLGRFDPCGLLRIQSPKFAACL